MSSEVWGCLVSRGLGLGLFVGTEVRSSGSRLTGSGAGPRAGVGFGVGSSCRFCTGCGVGVCGVYFLKYFLFRFVACREPSILTM